MHKIARLYGISDFTNLLSDQVARSGTLAGISPNSRLDFAFQCILVHALVV